MSRIAWLAIAKIKKNPKSFGVNRICATSVATFPPPASGFVIPCIASPYTWVMAKPKMAKQMIMMIQT